MKQILIEKNGVEHIMNIPDGSKVTIDGNVVVFEPKFKKGDIVSFDILSKFTAIYKNESEYFVIVSEDMYIQMLNAKSCSEKQLRLSTDSEKQLLFDTLAKEGKKWNAEKLCIEDLKVAPKVGDCVKVFYSNNDIYFGRASSVPSKDKPVIKTFSYLNNERGNSRFANEKGIFILYDSFEILTENQFKSELAQLGFEYNFENDTISEIKWKPKEGEIYWHITVEFEPARQLNDNVSYDLTRINASNCFKTKELCQQTIDKIKQVLNEK